MIAWISLTAALSFLLLVFCLGFGSRSKGASAGTQGVDWGCFLTED
jgi:hypothetical protein